MNTEFIQNMRYKLQKRFRKLNVISNFTIYHYSLIQFWKYLNENNIFKGILDDLLNRYPEIVNYSDNIINNQQGIVFDKEIEHVFNSYLIIEYCVKNKDYNIELRIARMSYNNSDNPLDFFNSYFVETLYDYIDEQLDDQRILLALLRKYKHKCEWFKQEELFNLSEEDTRKGEIKLAKNLYEFLYDQGIEFFIEPQSISGEVDLISVQNKIDPLIADTKIFNKNPAYIIKGFNQIYQYTLDYNQPFGYMILFKKCEEDLKFLLKEKEQSTPFIIYNNKTIFFIIINLYQYKKSASKRGKLKTYEINESELIDVTNKKDSGE